MKSRKLTAAESVTMRNKLLGFVAPLAKHARSKRLAAVLGCSERTARRMLAGSHNVRMRRSYAAHASAYLGVPITVFCSKPPPAEEKVSELPTWEGVQSDEMASRLADALLAYVRNLVRVQLGLYVSHMLTNDMHGRPVSLSVWVPMPNDKRATLKFYVHDRKDRLRLDYTDSNGVCQYSAIPDIRAVETILKHIK